MIKKSELKLYEAQRYTRALIGMNVKDGDEVISVNRTDGNSDVFVATNTGYGLWYHESDITPVGLRAAGVKSIQLKTEEYVVNGQISDDMLDASLVIVTQRSTCKRMTFKDYDKSSKARIGLLILRELKNKPYSIARFFVIYDEDSISLRAD